MKSLKSILLLIAIFSSSLSSAQTKPKITLDEFFNSVDFRSIALSPDGNSVVIETERADWDRKIFRTDLWLYRDGTKSLIQLTQSGHDSEPQWSPDGHWIAFLSERKPSTEKDSDSDDKGETAQLYLISPTGGEAIPLTTGEEEVHTYSWSADSRTIYFATRQPWTKSQNDEYRSYWKDILEYRTAERGDSLFALDLPAALARHTESPSRSSDNQNFDPVKDTGLTPGARLIAPFPLRIEGLVTSPDGAKLAFISDAVNQREEKIEDTEIFVVDLSEATSVPSANSAANANAANSARSPIHSVTHNQAIEVKLHWATDSRHLLFTLEEGDVSGPYRDLQPHLYSVDSITRSVQQFSPSFPGTVDHYSTASDKVLVAARVGTEVAMYSVSQPSDPLHKLDSWPGTYEKLSTSAHSSRIAFQYSSLQRPTEIYLADTPDQIGNAHPITSFNEIFNQRALPRGKPYTWTADDGTIVEGMLIYPPGIDPASPTARHLPLFTFIHGGPFDAEGNRFGDDWDEWAPFAATSGWLVFAPNYRGSTGYGDKFAQQIVPQLVSRPGKDILEGVDALVRDGIADPERLTIGGYSYGGFLTNWLITQTTRFKAAVTGAGAVEHVGNWGNDDTTLDDAYFLGGRPWEAAQRYHDEAAIFQMDKVKTPTHIVAGSDDIRVAVLEQYLLEHALYSLGVPHKLLIFPGEGHSLRKNPWHGKIKVREELLWLQKYAGVP